MLLSDTEISALEGQRSTVWQTYYLARICAGEKGNPKEIRERVSRFSLSFVAELRFEQSPADPDAVIRELFRRLPYDELLLNLDFWSDDGPIAYEVLAERHFAKFRNRLMADLEDNFERFKIESKSPQIATVFSFSSPLFGRDDASRKEFLTASALSGLALHCDSSDRKLFLSFLETSSSKVRIAAIHGLGRVGLSSDSELLLKLAEQTKGEVSVAAAQAAISLVPGGEGAAGRLLATRTPILLKLAISALGTHDTTAVWNQIQDRLYDDDDEIRKIVCAYAIKTFSPARLAKLLDAYLAKERYFYNAVFWLDRVLYAKLPLRRMFKKEIEDS